MGLVPSGLTHSSFVFVGVAFTLPFTFSRKDALPLSFEGLFSFDVFHLFVLAMNL